jgi:hypothetical protein
VKQIKDKTDSYIVGDMACVAVTYKKELSSNGNFGIAFESKTKRLMDKWEGQSAYLNVFDMSYAEVAWLNEKEPNTHKLFSNSTAQLVICYGRQEWLSEESFPHDISISENKAFIYWQVESMEYFNSFAYALSSNKELSLKVEIACNDEKIGERLNDKVMKEAIYKISATFE